MNNLKPFFEKILTQLPLWQALLRFNAHPVPASCPTGKEPASEECSALFRTLSRGMPDRCRKSSAQKNSYFWDFSGESQKISLLDDSSCTALARIVGVTLHSKDIAHCIQKEEIAAVKNYIGDALFSYAVLRGQFIVGSSVNLLPFLGSARAEIVVCGWRALWLVSFDWPKSLRNRFLSRIVDLAADQPAYFTADSEVQNRKVEDRENDSREKDSREEDTRKEDTPKEDNPKEDNPKEEQRDPHRKKEELRNSLLALREQKVPAAARSVLWLLVRKCLVWEVAPSWMQYFTP